MRRLINKAKSAFLSNFVSQSANNPRSLWKALNSILHRNQLNSLPDESNTATLANAFLEFFTDKIDRIRANFTFPTTPDPFIFPSTHPSKLFDLLPTNISEVRQLIFSSTDKQCPLDR